jgi:hypothetical protein
LGYAQSRPIQTNRVLIMFDDIQKPYIRAEKTDVLALFKKQGWVPPSENQEIVEKWATYRNLQAINEEKAK